MALLVRPRDRRPLDRRRRAVRRGGDRRSWRAPMDSGANFGWSAFEGTDALQRRPGGARRVKPVLTYGRDGGCSVTGGSSSATAASTASMGATSTGTTASASSAASAPRTRSSRARRTDDVALGLAGPAVSSFAEDESGQIYATSLDGPVYRLVPEWAEPQLSRRRLADQAGTDDESRADEHVRPHGHRFRRGRGGGDAVGALRSSARRDAGRGAPRSR